MTLTFRALCYLYAFDHKLPIQNGLAFESLVRAARLDYSVQSLERIDVLLDALRKTGKMQQDTYLDDPSQQNLLYLLAFYVGEVIGRSLGAAPQWATYQEMAARESQINGPHFENSATLLFPPHLTPRTAWLLPLASICSRVFDESVTKSVLFSAGLMLPPEALEKPASQQPLPPVPAPAWDVDVAAALASYTGPRETVDIEVPPWGADDELRYLFDNAPALLREGRVVLGAIVQVNNLLLKPGIEAGAPGEVLYDPHGRVPRNDLHEIASLVLSLKGREFSDASMEKFSRYLADETTRLFGLDVPAEIGPYPVKVSSTWFDRRHLPAGMISDAIVPLLISDAHPGAVVPLPAAFWPAAMTQQWSGAVKAAGGYVPDPALAHLQPMSLTEEGLLWFKGTSIAQDYAKARAAWEQAASKGNAGALYGMGMLYEGGHGVQADEERALDFYERAESKNYGPAADAAERIRARMRGEGDAKPAAAKGLLGRIFGKK